MKRILSVITVLFIVLSSFGCSGIITGNRDIESVLDEDMKAVLAGEKAPIAVVYNFQGNGVGTSSPIIGEESINAVIDAIKQIKIIRKSDISVTDNDMWYSFIDKDGAVLAKLSFNGDSLEVGDMKYVVDGTDALSEIRFPTKGRGSLLYCESPDAGLTEFIKRCEAEKPVSIVVKKNNDEYTVTGEERIAQVLENIYPIGILSAYQGVDESETVRQITFIMQDKTEYSMLFNDNDFIYQFSEPLSEWSYYMEGEEYLFEALDKLR